MLNHPVPLLVLAACALISTAWVAYAERRLGRLSAELDRALADATLAHNASVRAKRLADRAVESVRAWRDVALRSNPRVAAPALTIVQPLFHAPRPYGERVSVPPSLPDLELKTQD